MIFTKVNIIGRGEMIQHRRYCGCLFSDMRGMGRSVRDMFGLH